MKVIAFTLALLGTSSLAALSANATGPESFELGRFGRVEIERAKEHPTHVVLFLSGDGGWNKGVVEMVRDLREQDDVRIAMAVARLTKERTPDVTSQVDMRAGRLMRCDLGGLEDFRPPGCARRLCPRLGGR